MSFIGRFTGQGRTRFVAASVAMLVAAGIGVAVAGNGSAPAHHKMAAGMGVDTFGLTKANFKGDQVEFTYTKGYFCDTKIKSKADTKCEAGEKWKKSPSKQFDPLYITVPLGFTVPAMKMECPDGLVCVDHPETIDLTRLEPALKPLYPDLTDAQLLEALKNFATPGHQHFITTKAGGAAEWWDVRIVGVTDEALYNKIGEKASAEYLLKQVKAGKTTAVIPTNLFLFFSVN